MHSGDYDVIFDGIHENILQLQYHDPVMLKTVSLSYIQLSIATLIRLCSVQFGYRLVQLLQQDI